jgi:hypothetical protein
MKGTLNTMNIYCVKIAPRFLWGFLVILFLSAPLAWAKTALLSQVKGEVEILTANTTAWVPAQEGMELKNGDEVRTGSKSSVRVMIESSEVTLEQKTKFRFNSHEVQNDKTNTSLELMLGRLKANVQKLNAGSEFKITTPTSVAAVRGTLFDLFVFEYLGEWFTQLDVINGIVSFSDEDGREPQEVGAGQSLIGDANGATNHVEEGAADAGKNEGLSELADSNPFESQPGFQQDTPGSQDNAAGSPNSSEAASTKKSVPGSGLM